MSGLITSDAFAQRARHPSFPKAFTRGRKLPLPALIAALLSMRTGSQQALLDPFFTNLQASVGDGAELVRGGSDRAFAKARSHLHMPALNWLNDWVLDRAETAGIVKRWHGLRLVAADGLRPSVHAAAKACKDLPVSVTALYDKINHTEPGIVRALVQGCAERLEPVLQPMRQGGAPTLPGYRVRILDGNHLAASEKRLKALREFRGAALPGQSLVVYDPDTGLVVDLVPCEDAHAQERALMGPLLQAAQPDELWIGDRNFCTRPILAGWHARGCAFLVREHGRTPNPTVCTGLRSLGRVASGKLLEQQVSIDDDAGQPVVLRRIELQLDTPTEDGETVIRLLTNLPQDKVDAKQAAELYRRRWRIESMFQRIESVLNSEITTLGQPRAALLAFGVAVLAYNVLAVLQTAITAQHKLEQASQIELSAYYLAVEIRAHYAGMMVAVTLSAWQAFEALSPKQLAKTLLQMAGKADPHKLRKHPRGPKVAKKKGYVCASDARKHVSTARVLQAGRVG